MTLRTRLAALERRAADRRPDPLAAARAESDRCRADFLARVPADLRPRAEAALDDPNDPHQESLWSLALWPFARWAGLPPAGFAFPPALVGWMLDPPRDYWLGHHCGRCGLAVPLYLTRGNGPAPPANLVAFPACPACGGRTSWAAAYGPDPPAGAADVP